MAFDINTKISEIIKQYPWLPDELTKIDGRFDIINNPVGKMLLKNATVSDIISKTGMQPEDAMAKLNDLIASHK